MLAPGGAAHGRARERADDSDSAAHPEQHRAAATAAPARTVDRARTGAHHGHHPDDPRQRRTRRRTRWPTSRCRRSATSTRTSTSPSSATSGTPPPNHCAADDAILAAAARGVDALNARHGQGGGDRFFLFHRTRQWNEQRRPLDGMGAQARARSKSSTACCAARPTRASPPTSATSRSCRTVRYCITLDSDTRLPRDAARQLIGIISIRSIGPRSILPSVA